MGSCFWTVSGVPFWITVSGASSGTGSGQLTLSVAPNTGDPLGDFRRMVEADNTIHHDSAHPSQVILPVIPGSP